MLSDFHARTLIRCASATKYVSMDATHGTNRYALKLITIMVKDETGHGVPVGHCISNKEQYRNTHCILPDDSQQVWTNIT